ncbi:hypothetical protein GA662_10530, partial [Bifidobacterium adolescentis]
MLVENRLRFSTNTKYYRTKVLYKIKPRHFIDQEYLLTKEEAMIEDFLPIIQKYLDAGEYQSFLG